jgi:MFS family permease
MTSKPSKSYNPASFIFKASILAISIDATASGVVSGAIPLLKESFAKAPTALVESISTLPSLSIMLFVLLSSFITKAIGYKKTVLLGLFISFLSGIAPFFLDNLYLILVSRFLFGAGIGMLNPLSYSIISYFYEGDTRAKMFGLISTVSNTASVILTAFVGLLLTISWKASFLTYFVLLAVFFLVLFFVPDVKIEEEKGEGKTNIFHELRNIDKRVFACAAGMFILFSIFMTINIKLGLLITGKGYGDATQTSFILSLSNLTGIVIGVIFGNVYKHVKEKLFPIMLIVMALGLFGLISSGNIFVTGGMIIVLAAAFSFMSTYLFLRVSNLVPKEKNNIVSSIMLIAINLGGFLAPYVMAGLALLAGTEAPSSSLMICAFILLGVWVIVMMSNLFYQRQGKMKSSK